jgi:phage tail sheath protein FI
MGQMKTPGVYVVEKSAFPNSVVEVATAVPAFIGYTEKANNKGKSLRNVPWRISSMSEFHEYFGFGPTPIFDIVEKPENSSEDPAFSLKGTEYQLKRTSGGYLLYFSMLLFFQNGGGPCYIVSVGNYADDIDADTLRKSIDLLLKEQEPTMVVIPETVRLKEDNWFTVSQAALKHCGEKMKNRIAILDIWGGYRDRQDPNGDCIESFRSALGVNFLDYASAYYPWLRTTIVSDKAFNFENIGNPEVIKTLIKTELDLPDSAPAIEATDSPAEKASKIKVAAQLEAIDSISSSWEGMDAVTSRKSLLEKTLRAMSSVYGAVLTEMQEQLNLLPPAAAMAGVYTMVDNARGVWKAPANVSLNAVVAPAVSITHDEQEDLNVTTQGKSINAIRTFIGEGVLVWGARTLDGNSLDWRYVNVRRTMIMLEESIRLAAKAYVFDPNVSSTWVTIRSMIRNFLTGIWKRGGLAGATPDEAFSIHVGLGETMTPEDILEGILRVTVLVAISRPAEFIEITFQQQMQKS